METKINPEWVVASKGVEETKRQIYIDASLLKDSSCFRKIWWRVYKQAVFFERGDNYKIAFANAIHYFMEDFYKRKLPKEQMLSRAKDYYEVNFAEKVNWTNFEFRSTTNLCKIMLSYMKKYWNSEDDDFIPLTNSKREPIVEYKFARPLWSNEKFELILAGTLDLVCAYQGYSLVLVDHKLDSFNIPKNFFEQFDMNIQTQMYSKIYKEDLGLEEYPPVVINGIFCKKPTIKAEQAGLFDGVNFERSNIIQYDKDQMNDFNQWLETIIAKVIFYLEEITKGIDRGTADHNRAACPGSYGRMCEYFDVCKLPTFLHEAKLDSYKKEEYNPLKFRD